MNHCVVRKFMLLKLHFYSHLLVFHMALLLEVFAKIFATITYIQPNFSSLMLTDTLVPSRVINLSRHKQIYHKHSIFLLFW
jgi:hypothetical protein